MIGIRTENGVFLDLYPDTQIQLRQFSPIFSELGVIEGSDTIPFRIPMSQKNIAELGHLDVLESPDPRNKTIKATVFWDNTPVEFGTLKIESDGVNSITGTFLKGLATLGDGFKNKKLRELLNEEVSVTGADVDRFIELQWIGPASGNFDLEVAGDTYSEPYATSVLVTLQALAGQINTTGKVSATAISPDRLKIEPLDLKDYSFDFNINLDANWGIYATYIAAFNTAYSSWINDYATATPPDDILRFPVMYNNELYRESGKKSWLVNHVSFNVFLTNLIIPSATYVHSANSLAPHVLLTHIWDKIAEYGQVVFQGDFFDDTDIQKLLVFTGQTIDFISNLFTTAPFIHWKHTFNIADLVPDITIGEFIKDIATVFNQGIIYNDRNNTITFIKKEAIISDPDFIDITEMCGPATKLEESASDGYVLKSEVDSADKLATLEGQEGLIDANNPWKPQAFGNEKESISTKLSGIPSGDISGFVSGWANVDDALLIHLPKGDSSFRLSFYLGLKVFDGSSSYPHALIETDNYSLSWYGTKGLYEKWWKDWIRYLQRRRLLTLPVDFHLRDFPVDFTRKVRFDRSSFLIKSISTTLTMTSISESQVEMEKS